MKPLDRNISILEHIVNYETRKEKLYQYPLL